VTSSGLNRSTGYETLLYDAMIGDATLFQRNAHRRGRLNVAMLFSTSGRRCQRGDFPNYPARQSWGPETAEVLIHRDGREWRKL